MLRGMFVPKDYQNKRLVLPLFECSSSICDPDLKDLINKIEQIQRMAAHINIYIYK